MVTIRDLRQHIRAGLAPHLQQHGLSKANDFVYWHRDADCIRMLEIAFLRPRDASYFGCTSASFSLLFGAHYGSLDWADQEDFPAVHYSHVRGHLSQAAEELRDPLLSQEQRSRQDIWWVEKSLKSADAAVASAGRTLEQQLGRWLDRLRNRDDLCRFLYWSSESEATLYGFGRKGSPGRVEALRRICPEGQASRWHRWRLLLLLDIEPLEN